MNIVIDEMVHQKNPSKSRVTRCRITFALDSRAEPPTGISNGQRTRRDVNCMTCLVIAARGGAPWP